MKHSCPICSKPYAYKKILNRHIATVHDSKVKENEFKCTLCDIAAFTQDHNLKRHIESVHEGKKAEK